jgi:hypothetical protein
MSVCTRGYLCVCGVVVRVRRKRERERVCVCMVVSWGKQWVGGVLVAAKGGP